MKESLLIIFIKNPELGEVKTRLATSIGDKNALNVYKKLLQVTEAAAEEFKGDRILYTSKPVDRVIWPEYHTHTQKGSNLGERMKNAFEENFEKGYKKIVLIGSDLADLEGGLLNNAVQKLNDHEVVLGPAKDGGYYLIGMSKMHPAIFKDKPWSKEQLFNVTMDQLEKESIPTALLEEKNDIDTIEDLRSSRIYDQFQHLD